MKGLIRVWARALFNTKEELTLLFLFLCVVLSSPAMALLGGITANGGWTETVNSSDLTGGAGTNLNSTYTSATNATLISVSATLDLLGWTVSVQKSDSNWHANFHLYVKRNAGGSGCNVVNGTGYQEVTTSSQTFFHCPALLNNGGSNYPVQYQLTGMSISVPPGTYTTTVIYTVTGGVL